MPIYKKLFNGTVMGFTPEEMAEKSEKRDFHKEITRRRVTKIR